MMNSNIAGILASISVPSTGMTGSNSSQTGSTDDFSSVMQIKTSSLQTAPGSLGAQSQSDIVQDINASTRKDATPVKQNEYAADKINQAENRGTQKKETVSEKLEEFSDKVKDQLESQFGVSEEELTQTMQMLGLNFVDLIDPQNLTTLSMQLTGSTDVTSLLTNDNFLELMQNMQTLTNELLDGLSLDAQQFQEILSQMDVTVETPVSMDEQLTDAMLQDGQNTGTDLQAGTKTAQAGAVLADTQAATDQASTVQTTQTTTTESQDTGESTQESQNLVEVIQTQTESSGSENSTTEDESDSELQQLSQDQTAAKAEDLQSVTTHTTFERVIDAVGNEVTSQVTTTTVNTQDIINQIAEYTRVQISPTVSRIEMQLNPENLGKIFLEVAEKEGQIHAQIIAQNEAVKDALLTQMSTLRDTLNEQGVKVQAVEVTVGTHEFENNLEENQQENEQSGQQEQQQGRRNINLKELDEWSGLMTEEETLVAQIMKDNGNSVDLTA